MFVLHKQQSTIDHSELLKPTVYGIKEFSIEYWEEKIIGPEVCGWPKIRRRCNRWEGRCWNMLQDLARDHPGYFERYFARTPAHTREGGGMFKMARERKQYIYLNILIIR